MVKRYFVIPARKGSKGFPYKNRVLVPTLMKSLFLDYSPEIILTSDDSQLLKLGTDLGVTVRQRPPELAVDSASVKDVVVDVVEHFDINKNDIVVVLYPTYPERTMGDIDRALTFFKNNNLSSMLCKNDVITHPYLCMLVDGNIHAKPLIDHSFYRRQDYPECFEICHFICILKAGEVVSVNDQLFNEKTGFYKIEHKIDVDHQHDYNKFKESAV